MSSPFFDIPEVMSINGNRLLIRKYFEEFTNRKEKTALQKKNETNLRDNTCKGLINRKIRLKMRAIITNWIEALELSPVNENGYKIYYPTFITLTLPAEQLHTDKELHAKALARFIQDIKRTHKVENYLWRAERQDNGNLHYHIIVDKFIGWQLLRTYWNRIMTDLGYIAIYRTNQQEHHKNGFNYRENLSKYWSYEKQLEAYNQGIKDNWSNPNTTDIHKLDNIEDVASYVGKYVAKSDEFDQLLKLKKSLEGNTITEEFYNESIAQVNQLIEKKRIDGRVWGCSDSLKELKDPKIIVDGSTFDFIDEVMKSEDSKIIKDDNYTIIYNKKLKQHINKNGRIKKEVTEHHRGNFYYLHPHLKPQLFKKEIEDFSTKKEAIPKTEIDQLILELF